MRRTRALAAAREKRPSARVGSQADDDRVGGVHRHGGAGGDGATRGAAARPGAHDDAVIWVKASMAKGRGESVSQQTGEDLAEVRPEYQAKN